MCRKVCDFHDVAKYTDYYQDYLIDGKDTKYKNHAHLSACLLFLNLTDDLKSFFPQKRLKDVAYFIAYLSVRLHHSHLRLENLFFDSDVRKKAMQEELLTQSKNILEKLTIIQGELNEIDINLGTHLQNINRVFTDKYFVHMPAALTNGRFSKDTNIWYFLLIYLYSNLIDNDKLDSANVKGKQKVIIHPEVIDAYIQKKHGTKLNDNKLITKRKRAKETMTNIIENLNGELVKNLRFYTITAPTGLGKTLAALECALRLRNKIKEVEGYTPRIITAIPFINIIEQTRIDYEMICKDGTLVVHHSLADFAKVINSKSVSDESNSLDKLLLEVESWDGDIILTTFVQLFHSLLTDSNRALKKINKLAGSIVILDEVQAIPAKYMPLIGALLIKLGEYFGTRFILMTATQPKILEFGQKLLKYPEVKKVELFPDNEKYFNSLKRTKLIPLLEYEMTQEDVISLFLEKWQPEKSALIVVNTIKRSIEIYNKLIKKQKEGKINKNTQIYYLSTNIIPLQRKKVINEIKKKLDAGISVILVSTQTIEAGVDLDFDIGFRDLGPLESLIQIAGRINRENKKGEFLPVYVFQIKEGTQTDCQSVYKLHRLDRTKKLLIERLKETERNYIEEYEYRLLVEKYYQKEFEAGIAEESRVIWEGIKKLAFKEITKFQLIEQAGEIADVFVELDETATCLANAYETIKALLYSKKDVTLHYDDIEKIIGKKIELSSLSIFELKALIKLIKSKMNEYIIQLRVNRAVKNRPLSFNIRSECKTIADFFWIPKENINEYYDLKTGFIDETGAALFY